MNKDALTIFWLIDSGGTITCHRNGSGLSYEDSKLCTVLFKDDKLFYRCPGSDDLVGPFESLARLRKDFRAKVHAGELY